ncbi:Na+/H+ antiporter [Mycobacterium heidelbergense]|uniref:Na+/H+ antiporter n=1 Tax=Mycobacterium heidelbergense TaxID=53376 RepID=A0A1X0DM46_MYCHE|nr:Na+/H+ antiporter [Mycobacterium heidelbergense]MCV7051237.1 Na+/H+ antiporter [Mycobacterium heidelbergense]ORA73232.1 Na+/H+ antiporter [Mycobacterium heidelbergense]BBZ52030.1 putative Na(+)/H(+) exchanger [Mycobacterium heidelbergense]
MFALVLIVALVSTVIVGTVIGRRYRVGPPVLLILLGALLGLIPQFGDVRIDGEIVLLLFLPAILYWEGLNTSFREIRANARIIVFLSVALVIATAAAVSWTARALGMDPHAAGVLGAVLSPTDAAAVAGLAKKLPRRSLTVLKAESLINDGTALVLFAVSVHVAIGGAAISPPEVAARFVVSYLGGIAAGLLVGGLATLVRKRIDAPQEEGALSLLTPFAAFLLAQAVDCSGVVAVMVSALVLAYSGPVVIRARSRLQAYGFWDIATFLINGSLWVFVGVQIPGAVRGIANVDGGLRHAAYIALAVTGVVILSRVFWGEITTVLIRLIDRRQAQRERRVSLRQRFVTAWAGFRGAVSLAAAVAVPTTTLAGAPFPDRSLLIFIVVFVILVTVLVQGITLPAVVRWARIPEDVTHAKELQLARTRGVQAALDALPTVADEVGISDDLRRRLEKEYEEKAALVVATEDGSTNDRLVKGKEKVRRVRLGVLERKRHEITALRNQNLIDDIVLRELQQEMDLEEVQLLDAAEDD